MSYLDDAMAAGYNALMGQSHQQLVQQSNQAFNNAYNQYGGLANQSLAQQQLSQYNQMLGARQETKWKFNGIDLNVRDMANAIWANDCPEKTHFLLKYE